jgi:ribosome maturation factor RimP
MIQTDLEALLEPIMAEADCCLWGLEYRTQDRSTILRLYVDKPGGVTIADCESISRQVGAALDVEGLLSRRYRLEVSSPGIPRPLFKPSQYGAYLGREVQLKLDRMINGTRKIMGKIEEVTDEQVKVRVGESSLEIPFYQIVKAHLVDE